jgi:hypothetical protein
MPLQQVRNIKFVRAVEAPVSFCDFLPKQTIGAYDRWTAEVRLHPRAVYNHQVIANVIERIDVTPGQSSGKVSDGSAVLIKNLVTKLLHSFYAPLVAREPDLEMADSADRRQELVSLLVRRSSDEMLG